MFTTRFPRAQTCDQSQQLIDPPVNGEARGLGLQKVAFTQNISQLFAIQVY
jgi:hypothetical protein